MSSKDSLWRYIFLLATYITLGVIVVLMRQGGMTSIPFLSGFTLSRGHEEAIADPVRLRIPRFDIDVPIVPVDLTREGNMAIPSGAWETGWFQPGTVPGNRGNAVIAGHLDTLLGTPAVFWRLHELKQGDEILVGTASGQTVRFTVSGSLVYNVRNTPLTKIFGATSGQHLQLITCNGAWLKDARTYENRLVVFTNRADGESSSSSSTKKKAHSGT